MMQGGSLINAALAGVRGALMEMGFSRKGRSFFRKASGNSILLSIQNSVESSSRESRVTLNYGVYSVRIGRKLADDPTAEFDVSRAHWRKRLTEDGIEKWLYIRSKDSPAERGMAILDEITRVLPELAGRSTDEALRDEWLSGSSPGIRGMQRLLYLAVLLNEIGPIDKLPIVVRELRYLVSGKLQENFVERELARAGIRMENP
jgi:hypothetical protein